jgi:glutamate synthase (NADPH/NADH) large chain/glutamate synthase (ferredoxin)
MACLFGFGAQAVCPYMVYGTVREMLEKDRTARKPKFEGIDYAQALGNYRSGLEKGVLKIMSKMGISVLSSYQGAQIFEAVGIASSVIEECFTGTASQVEGIGYKEIAQESLARHASGFAVAVPDEGPLKLGDPGYYRWRRDGEQHQLGGPTIKPFHAFVRDNDPSKYEEYVAAIKQAEPCALHDLFEFVPSEKGPIPIEEVESIEDIRVRFTTAAMSLGAISPEAHEALAIAMNEIGGKSDSGEGGEDPARFNTNRNSKIKQIASGRFGVSAEYLANAEELEIKMAQGAKPGEGGQLPGHKVSGIIARLRNTVEGVTLISPPPHHDIYSIEDLAQLIHDLKQVNPRARVCVKLVAENGVGTVAAGVAKANADIILISGHEGGTGASPLSSIKHAGLPWELGLSETQQVLMLNGLRDRVTLRTDGGFKDGRDVIVGALLGAEEFNFGTTALIALGCVYVRQCHLNTCPVGIATQREDLRAKFKGDPSHVVNYFNAVADEARHIMASLGVAKMDDLIGHTGFLRQREVPDHPKANLLDLGRILKDVAPELGEELPRRNRVNRNDGSHPHPLDDKILQQAHSAIKDKTPVELSYPVVNTNRNIGTKLSGEVAYLHGNHGLPDGTITLNFKGSAGQSFGTFLCGGIRLNLVGEANDYVGKGMCGGEIVIRQPEEAKFDSWENSILGNTVMYGATGGQLFAAGRGGERFCVRNSGGTAVVEGVGDHGCEYMTGGTVVVLGKIGKNFGAGMSGGTAYLLDEADSFADMHNPEMIHALPLEGSDEAVVKELVSRHLERTASRRAAMILENWSDYVGKFIKVCARNAPPSTPADTPQGKGSSKAAEPVSGT